MNIKKCNNCFLIFGKVVFYIYFGTRTGPRNNKAMLTTTISDVRRNIKKFLHNLTKIFGSLVSYRSKDNGLVIIAPEEYNFLCTKQHELSSSTNEKRLDSAIEKLNKGSLL